MLKGLLWIVVPLGALAGLWLWAGSRPVPVDVVTVERGSIRSFVEEEGKTRVVDRFVISAPVGGRVERLDLDEGDSVKAGQVLTRIDPLPVRSDIARTRAEMRALQERIQGVSTKKPKAEEIERARVLESQAAESLSVAEHELDRAKASWARLDRELKRNQQLAEKRLVSLSDLDKIAASEAEAREQVAAQEVRVKIANLAIAATRLNRTVLESRVEDFDWEARAYEEQIAAFQASLEKLEDDLERTVVKAPVSGTVLRLLQESEQVVAPGTPLLEIGNLDGLEIEADFLSEDASHMRVEMPAEIYGRALGDRILKGRVLRIHPSAFEKISSLGVEQQRVKVVVTFDAAGQGLGDQFRVEVKVILETREDVVLVPEGALFRTKGAWHVFVADGGRATLRPVSTGLRDGRFREVREGLQAGERVVLHPGDALEDGVRVEAIGSANGS